MLYIYGNADVKRKLKSRRLWCEACCTDGRWKKGTQSSSRKTGGETPLGRPKIRWEGNIIWDLKEVEYEGDEKNLPRIGCHGVLMS